MVSENCDLVKSERSHRLSVDKEGAEGLLGETAQHDLEEITRRVLGKVVDEPGR